MSSHALGSPPFSTPTRKATFSLGRDRAGGSFDAPSSKGEVSHPLFFCGSASPRNACAFSQPDLADRSENMALD